MNGETPKEYYEKRIALENIRLTKLKNRKSAFAWLRLGAIAGIIIVFYSLWNAGWMYVAAGSIILLVIFIRLVYADLNHFEKIQFTKTLIKLYQSEIDAFDGNINFESGNQFIDKEHPYTSDLDIFGEGSLFQYLNRTTSEPGAAALAAFLQKDASIHTIEERQEAVKNLVTLPEWSKQFQTTGTVHRFTDQSNERLSNWMKQSTVFLQFKPWQWLRYVLPAIIITIVILFIFDYVGNSVFYGSLLIFAMIAWQINKVVSPVHQQLSDISVQLGSLGASLSLIEKQSFSSPLLNQLKKNAAPVRSFPSSEISDLKKLLDRLDLRYNFVVSLPLNLLLLWNLQQMLGLEKWKLKNKDTLNQWVNILSCFEALNSISIFSFNHPTYVFPTVTNDYFSIKGEEVGHPLIPQLRRVDNPVALSSKGKVMLVTGSNMAGKSTYLRSIGVNCVLAFCGSPVCAKEFEVSHVSLISSMRISDNLQESTSTFYAELKKLKVIIDRVNDGENVFILLDEILRGTNSKDRHTGSKALIRQLTEKCSAAIIATHDLELAEIKESYAENILNYHFDVQVSGEELYFDYKLKPGICRSMNASILMKKIGIEI